MAVLTKSNFTDDQKKMIAAKLIRRSFLKLVCASVCDKVPMEKGAATTAYFVRYKRMNVPVTSLTEGTDPSSSSFSIDSVNVTLDQWGDILEVSDIAILTTNHPLMQQIQELLSDNAQRVIDREIQIVWLAGTNVLYGDASVTSRSTITSSMILTDELITKAVVQLDDQGAPPRGGPSDFNVASAESSNGSLRGNRAFVGVAGPQVIADIRKSGTALGTWVSVAMYNNAQAQYASEVGMWLGVRWVATNFIPKFTLLGNTTTAVSSGQDAGITGLVITAVDGGGSLTSATTYYYKITRKDLLRGFEEAISIEHTTASAATGGNESFTFALPSTSGYVYNVYFGSSTGDSNLKLAAQNQAASATVTVIAVPSSTTTAPANVNTTGTPTIHVVYLHGAESTSLVTLQNLEFMMTKDESAYGNILKLKRAVGYKFMQKAMIRDQTRVLRLEVASSF